MRIAPLSSCLRSSLGLPLSLLLSPLSSFARLALARLPALYLASHSLQHFSTLSSAALQLQSLVCRTRSEGCAEERPCCAPCALFAEPAARDAPGSVLGAQRTGGSRTGPRRPGQVVWEAIKALEESPLTAIPSHIRSLCEGWRSRVGDGVSWTICTYH